MSVDIRIVFAAVVLLAATPASPQTQPVVGERCEYIHIVPRPDERPELPPLDFEGLSWSERPLLPAEDRHDVCMDALLNSPFPNQHIFMEEEIEGDVVIAKLNYKGDKVPTVVVPFSRGLYSLLRPVIRRIPAVGGDWHLVITNKQDFESPGMQSYMFYINIEDEAVSPAVSLAIVNIDDNDPIINMFGPCQVPEGGEPRVTKCKYTVEDPDGNISTIAMRYEIDSDRGDENIFSLYRENIPNEWRWCYMVLEVKEPLDFERNPIHIFTVTALDSYPNTHSVTMMVEVENVEHRPPLWMEIFPMRQFDEKIKRSFTVRAIDGDTGINKPIHYRLQTEKGEENLFELELLDPLPEEEGGGTREGAILHVGPIDRDALKKEVFELTITAYKYADIEGEIYETPANIVIIIDDVNDQYPEPLKSDGIYNIDIMEETAMTLNLEDFGFYDRDLGPRAQYTVHLESIYPPGVHNAFFVAPEVGYQRQSFFLSTQNHHMLDYDNTEIDYKKIQIRAVATDMDNNTMIGVAIININLIDWNDELPIFPPIIPSVSFPETVGLNFHVATVEATDRDIHDKLKYKLMGNADEFLRIDEHSGAIFVAVDDAFNYHRQNELFIQIRVDDTLGEGPYHTATAQLVIQLEDVNNTPPVLRLPRNSPEVKENVPPGEVVTREVRATDPDTTADLVFEIDWKDSYATKQGRAAPTSEFHNCVEIVTHYPDENNRGVAHGHLLVRKLRDGNPGQPPITIDYEEFEVMFLTVRVRDTKTEVGDDYDESTFTITIIDLNDNWPIWTEGQLDQQFRVREMSPAGVVIGSMHATDIDGPLYNQVRYLIEPKEGTPPDLVAIDFNTGQITVQKSQAIDADEPPRFYLHYKVTATDKCSLDDESQCPEDKTYWNTVGDIAIHILDTNNKVPVLETDKFSATVWIYEDADEGDEVGQLVASDLDRDLPNNNVSFTINYGVNLRIRDFFVVDLVTGMVRVHFEGPDRLDRDGDEPTHTIFFNILDNFMVEGDGNRNQIEGQMLVILLDVNDNAPELPSPENFNSWTISESALEGVRLEPEIFAPDRDEPGTDNSRVAYDILPPLTTDRDIDVPELFKMITIEKDRGINQTGELETAMPLQGYWGTYQIRILAYDHGEPQQKSNESYQLVIRPYNFHEPKFVFPRPDAPIRLSRERAIVSGELTLVGADQTPLERISATDEDGLHAGKVTFSVVGDDEALEYFDVWNDGENSGTLTLRQPLPEGLQIFQLTIRATDGGDEPGPKSTDLTSTVAFIPQGDPVFSPNTDQVAFVELEAGMLERHVLREAEDPKNTLCEENVNCYTIYYSIIDGNTAGHFALDGRTLYLRTPLDRDEHETHTLRVAASNAPGATAAREESILTVTVTVREANPRPHFERPLYTAGMSATDTGDTDRPLITVKATHTENLDMIYTIDQASMVVDPSLESVQELAFELNPETGELMRRIQPTISMHGMFEFDIVATDTEDATGRTHVKVYLISSRNRVYIIFYNGQDEVLPHRNFIADTFSSVYQATCSIEDILPNTDANGIPMTTETEVRAHFIKDDLPMTAEEINELRQDSIMWRTLVTTFGLEGLELSDVQAGAAPTLPGGDHALAVYILAGLAALLAVLCIILLVTFIIRNRALNRRIAALSMTKYSSVDSGLNRIGLAAPGTNKHAVEGSNPIWNETIKAPDFDAVSEVSNDSDLIGIEDLPQFRNDYFPPEFENNLRSNDVENPEPISARNPIANHENNFGFNTTPFSPEFANSQLRR